MEEADGAVTKKDFAYKVSISRKEARESRYWLRICLATDLGDPQEARWLHGESDELVRILSSIISKAEQRKSPSGR